MPPDEIFDSWVSLHDRKLLQSLMPCKSQSQAISSCWEKETQHLLIDFSIPNNYLWNIYPYGQHWVDLAVCVCLHICVHGCTHECVPLAVRIKKVMNLGELQDDTRGVRGEEDSVDVT